MSIQRQYNLPNCSLTLDGFGDGSASPSDLRPVMSILTNAECNLMGQPTMRGGKDFFEGLIATVSLYAQEVLSGIRVPAADEENHPVHLERLGPDQHQLTFAPADGESQTLEMNTVQLFDLVDAIDQFIADAQTLPQWSLGLKPASKKFAPKDPLTKQAVPLAAGLGSLAIAAAAFVAVPIPEIKTPDDLVFTPTEQTQKSDDKPSDGNQPGNTDQATTGATDAGTEATGTAKVTSTKTGSASDATPQTEKITDPDKVKQLSSDLEKQLQTNFDPNTPVTEPVAYNIQIGQDGKILDYRPENDAATNSVNQTPLPKLRYNPVPGSDANEEPIASFRAEFTPKGEVRVTPSNTSTSQVSSSTDREVKPELDQTNQSAANSAPQNEETVANQSVDPPTQTQPAAEKPETEPAPDVKPEAPASQTSSTGEIRQRAPLIELQKQIYNQVDKSWKAPSGVAFKENLTFSVRADAAGKIIDYAPYDQVASDYTKETPLPDLGKTGDIDAPPDGSYARFKVVFKPNGQLEVNPWDGYPESAQ